MSIAEKIGYVPQTLHEWVEPIGNIPPAKAEDQYYAVAENIDMAA